MKWGPPDGVGLCGKSGPFGPLHAVLSKVFMIATCEPAYIKLLTMMDEVHLSPVGPTVRSSLVGIF